MRQLAVSSNSLISGGAVPPLVTAYVPANSWAQNKQIIVRYAYQLKIPVAVYPPTYNITEDCQATGTTTGQFLIPVPFVPSAGTYTTYVTRRFSRDDPNITFADDGDLAAHWAANEYDGRAHFGTISPIIGHIDYSAELFINLIYQLPPTIPFVTIVPLYAQALIETATNIGRLS